MREIIRRKFFDPNTNELHELSSGTDLAQDEETFFVYRSARVDKIIEHQNRNQ